MGNTIQAQSATATEHAGRRIVALFAAIVVGLLSAVAGASSARAADANDVIIVLNQTGKVTLAAGQSLTLDASKTRMGDNGAAEFFFSWTVDGEQLDDDGATFTFKGAPGNHRVNVGVYAEPTNGVPSAAEATVDIQVGADAKPKAVITPTGELTVAQGKSIALSGAKSQRVVGGTCTWYVDGRQVDVGGFHGCFSPYDGVPTLDYKPAAVGNHLVQLKVTDSIGASDTAAVRIKAYKPGATTATFTPGTNQRVQAPSRITFDGSASTAVDQGSLTYAWYLTGANAIAGVASKAKTFTPNFTKAGSNQVRLEVTDSTGKKASKSVSIATFTATCKDPAKDVTVRPGTSLTFRAECWTDNPRLDLASVTYSWRSTGVRGEASKASTYTRKFTDSGKFGVELRARDKFGAYSRVHRYVTVAKDELPVSTFTPGSDLTVPLGSKVAFNGSASKDPDGGKLKYAWFTTGIRGAVSPTSSYARTFTSTGKYRVRLEVTDDEGNVAKKTVQITVKADEKPVASFTPASDSTVAAGTKVSFNGSASRDPDGGALTYRWYTTGIGGAVSKTNSYARTFSKAGKYRVRLEVIDDERNRVAKQIEITVT